jgi:hypothetical protein
MVKKCIPCNYETSDKSNFTKHLKSDKHITMVEKSNPVQVVPMIVHQSPSVVQQSPSVVQQSPSVVQQSPSVVQQLPSMVQPIFKCILCEAIFKLSSSLSKHKAKCSQKYCDTKIKTVEEEYTNKIHIVKDDYTSQINKLKTEYDNKIREYADENNKLKNEIANLKLENTIAVLTEKLAVQDHLIKKSDKENDYQKHLIESAGNIVHTAVSSMTNQNYIIHTYKTAPVLEALEDYSTIEESKDKIIESVLHYYKQNALHKYLGDFIIKAYKKDDPSKQPVWNSDTARLTYMIRELAKKNRWVVDKKGIKMKEKIINPLITYLKVLIKPYLDEWNEEMKDANISNRKMSTLLKKIELGNTSLESNTLVDDIARYIAPHLYIKRDDIKNEVMQIELEQ